MTAVLDRLASPFEGAEWRPLFTLTAIAVAVGAAAGIVGLYPLAFVLGLAPFALVAFRSLRAGCMLIVLTAPVVALGSIDAGFHLLPCYVFVAATLVGAILRGDLRGFEPRLWDWLLLGFLVVAGTVSVANMGTVPRTTVIHAVGANAPQLRSIAQLVAIGTMAALYLVLRIYLTRPERVEALLRTFIVATTFVALYAAYQAIGERLGLPYTFVNARRALGTIPAHMYLRPNSTLTEASPLALYMLAGLFLALAWLRSSPARPSWISRRTAAVLAMGTALVIVFTLSVAAAVACSLLAPLVLALSDRRWRRRIALAAGVLLVLAVVIVLPKYRAGGANAGDVVSAQRYVREGYWIAALHTTSDHPFGVGVGNFAFYYPIYAPLNGRYEYQVALSDAHNVFLDAAAETGIAGALLFAGFYASLFWAGLRSAVRASAARSRGALANIALALSAALAAAMFMHLTYSYPYYPFEWVVAAMVGSLPMLLRPPSRDMAT